MSPHVDILDQPERLASSFFGSLAFHGLLVAAVAGAGWVQGRTTISMGDPKGGRFGAVTVNPVTSIALPSHAGIKNPVATDTESAVPVPVSKAKPAPKVTAPDPNAVPIPSRNAKVSRPSPAAAPPGRAVLADHHDQSASAHGAAGEREVHAPPERQRDWHPPHPDERHQRAGYLRAARHYGCRAVSPVAAPVHQE